MKRSAKKKKNILEATECGSIYLHSVEFLVGYR
jgi:hypothetical protein